MKMVSKILFSFFFIGFCSFALPIKLLVNKEEYSAFEDKYEFFIKKKGKPKNCYCIATFDKKNKIGDIDRIFVNPQARRNGLASTLMRIAIKSLEKQGAKQIKVVADPFAMEDDEPGRYQELLRLIAWYKTFGFQMQKDEDGDDKYYYDPLIADPLGAFMELNLS